MARLSWGTPGERFYETGIDRGVLFVDDHGVAWNGLISVSEAPEGGEVTGYYIDGVKYTQTATSEDFAGTLEAFSSPKEFGVCDGSRELFSGFIATQQKRKKFALSYRTQIGNDVEGLDYPGYKIHVVYNALAGPSSRKASTLSDSPEPTIMSWEITTRPERIPGFRPTAHFMVDSRVTPPETIKELEDYLYGTDSTAPQLPSPAQILGMFR